MLIAKAVGAAVEILFCYDLSAPTEALQVC
jgi:hypothetical protein